MVMVAGEKDVINAVIHRFWRQAHVVKVPLAPHPSPCSPGSVLSVQRPIAQSQTGAFLWRSSRASSDQLELAQFAHPNLHVG
jgi:hypothetical protein